MTISVSAVGKAYPRFKSRFHALGTWLGVCRRDLHWVLRDIDFRVEQGEAVGLIGVNGAGKSTLLKLITGTSVPTEGHICTPERIAALLELGMGFHADFTGRQNVMLAGRMQGLERDEILALMPEIEAFADIGHYIDEPVRTYSSGMFVRLAFSVATAVRPEVLIIDEALAVGDTYFQHKSFARIREFREQGTTLLFVSHDPTAIKSLCDRAILLGEGRVLMDGAPDSVLDQLRRALGWAAYSWCTAVADAHNQCARVHSRPVGRFHDQGQNRLRCLRQQYLAAWPDDRPGTSTWQYLHSQDKHRATQSRAR